MALADGTDRIDTGGLPPELTGKSATEIATYYIDRENQIMTNARSMVAEAQRGNSTNVPAPQAPTRKPVSKEDFWNDPEGSTRSAIAEIAVSKEDFNRLTTIAQQGLVNTARLAASEGKADWARYDKRIREVVGQLPLEQQIAQGLWEEAYFSLKGRDADNLVTAARTQSSEPPSAPPIAPLPPKILTDGERRVINGLGITEAQYRKGELDLETGTLPFTVDNRPGRGV